MIKHYFRSVSGAFIVFIVLIIALSIFIILYHNQLFMLVNGISTLIYVKNRPIIVPFEKFITNSGKALQQTYNILTNPSQYLIQSQVQSQASNQSLNTYISLSCGNACYQTGIINEGVIRGFDQLFQFSYSLPQNDYYNIKVNFLCTLQASCFNKTLPVRPESVYINSPISSYTIECILSSVNVSKYGCQYYNTFNFNINLNATLENINTYTTYKFLVASSNLAILAQEKGQSIYSYLNLNPSEFDVNIYNGIQGLPLIYIYRVNSNVEGNNYPEIVFGKNITYDDIIVFINPLQNIESINNIKILFYYNPNDLRLSFFNLENQKCSNDISLNETVYYYNCFVNNGVDICNIHIYNKVLQLYEAAQNNFYIVIPICVQAGNDFNGYSDVNILANMTYDYELSTSAQASMISST